jgi:hypothetical protein
MGFRFQRRLQLFPGVRLSFSRSGISTTIGVRAASFTLGGQGAHMNVGIPGTGLSFRQKIIHAPDERSEAQSRHRNDSDEPPPSETLWREPSQDFNQETSASVAGAIRSGPVSAMTSVGLDGLKKQINKAAAKHIELTTTVAARESSLRRAQWHLQCAQWFIVRLFMKRAIPKLGNQVTSAQDALAQAREQLAGCSVEIDFAFDESTLNAFAAVIRSFEALIGCQKVWDITDSVAANRFAQRTIAEHNVARTLAALSFSQSEIIDTNHKALCFSNANGIDIYIYPGFVMLPSPSKDFALIDVRELQVKFSQSNFIEEEGVPTDTEVVGQTWKKANANGTRDRRFVNNVQLPIAKYAELEFRSSTGLWEVYQFSSYTRAFAFAQSLTEYQKAMARLAERSKDSSVMPLLAPPEDGPDGTDVGAGLLAESGVDMPVRHPATNALVLQDNGKTPVVIHLAGMDSVRFRKTQRANADRRFKGMQNRAPTAEELDTEGLDILVNCTLGWSGIILDGTPLECTPANVRMLYTRLPWVRKQVDTFMGNRANFLPNSAKN